MIPAKFDYVRAVTVDDALERIAADGDAKLLAGGHSLLPIMKMRLAAPSTLIDISGLRELTGLSQQGDVLHIGAGVRYRDLERSDLVRTGAPLLPHAVSTVGDPQVRSRGTIGGSVVLADPAADLPAVLLALGATMVLRGPNGERSVPAGDFFVGAGVTALAPAEVLVEIQVSTHRGEPWSYQKFRQRSHEWAVVGVAAQGGPETTVTLTNMASTPLRASGVEAALARGATREEASAVADEGTSPSADLRADVEYRRHLCRTLVNRALAELAT